MVVNPEGVSTYTTVTLRAEPFAGSSFKSWTGCTAVDGDPSACTVAVSSARSVTAKFEPASFPLSVTPTGPGVGTVTGAGLSCQTGGSAGCTVAVENPTGTTSYTSVTLSAAPVPGSVFKAWTGCTALPAAPAQCTVSVSSAKSVQARFEPDTYTVSVRGTGGGTGLLTGAGVECRLGTETCTFTVANPADSAAYATPTLTVVPDAGYIVRAWTGCTPLADPASCSVRVDGTESLTVRIEPATFRLTTTVTGSGTVTGGPIACTAGATPGCTAELPNGGSLTLVATPEPGMVLKYWTGCVVNADGSCTVTMTSAKTVTASFQPATFPLTISFSGTGAGSVAVGAATCASTGGTCAVDLANGAVLSLLPTPAAGSRFTGWSGACWGTGGCTVTMSTARFVQAGFASP
jgi:hypothetical protein